MNEEKLKEEQQVNTEDTENSAGDNNQAQGNNQAQDDNSGSEAGGLRAEVNKYKSQVEEYLQIAQRVQADFDNYRRRTHQEREELLKYSSARLATNLLPILDNFERAISSSGNDAGKLKEGIELIFRQLRDVLEKEGVKPMDAVGKEFDPNLHEAVMQEQSEEHADNVIIEELQKGYMLADRVIRPAMVKVAKS